MSGSNLHHVEIDGAAYTESLSRKAAQSPPRDDVCCIFVHAGAGYHSLQNERIHLEACNDAAQVAMLILRNGGSAVDAVEMAIKILEDREITNAGYGSNLAMDGVVECDASIVDHYGRSGAVGAVAQIKNPISLARLVLNHTMQSLTLRRVPPNLLVSQGAVDFAYEMGMSVLPYDALIAPAAHDRWLRWRADLSAAERKARKNGNPPSSWRIRNDPPPEEEQSRQRMREQHERMLLQHNPYSCRLASPELSDDTKLYSIQQQSNSPSPPLGPSPLLSEGSAASWQTEERPATPGSSMSEEDQEPPMAADHTVTESSRSAFINSTQKVPTINNLRDYRALRDVTTDYTSEDTEMRDVEQKMRHTGKRTPGHKSCGDGSEESDSASSTKTVKVPPRNSPPAAAANSPLPATPSEQQLETPTPHGSTPLNCVNENAPLPPTPTRTNLQLEANEDRITDTVGAIAIDSWGNIACGASSGGIGMKYRGRVGPAALVGVGAAVIPVDPLDPDRTTVATVTSGTGEHMATTMAATVCAERLFQSVRRGKGGIYESVSEDEALKAMIENEFMGHPSVRNSNSAGAIGILGIKKDRHGTYLYFGHNTDSFAMASMHSDEDKPWCAMSRSNGNGQVAQGGRIAGYKMKKKRTANHGRP